MWGMIQTLTLILRPQGRVGNSGGGSGHGGYGEGVELVRKALGGGATGYPHSGGKAPPTVGIHSGDRALPQRLPAVGGPHLHWAGAGGGGAGAVRLAVGGALAGHGRVGGGARAGWRRRAGCWRRAGGRAGGVARAAGGARAAGAAPAARRRIPPAAAVAERGAAWNGLRVFR
ncbi:glycine-rich cell wall structural protein 1.8-like [Cryptomeria japonica]|uniref:glycine-rich cell wall structural protein 1.8-like n=1 Tax=Cryptomeria japonica TaxID=3369 RepID=UPI0027DA25BF|nr:glycine-rich cell wall structural protein 1.8-like [Cryptomeria japonica]